MLIGALLVPGCGKADSTRVRVAGGELVGEMSGAVESFKGIPYAAAPVADLRWREPRPAPAWHEPRSAADFGASCSQAAPPSRVPFGSQAERSSEDCLTLNIWAPAPPAKAAPVMVWIHGGSNILGSGADRYYDGTAFARDGVVLVTFNYRLGRFGFFAHPALTREAAAGAATNFGLLDQMAALQWVRQNIGAFGGDPGNITLFGESAGATDIVALMAMPASRGLFQRAIVQSAALWRHWPTLAEAQQIGAKVATGWGLAGADASPSELRAVPSADLISDNELSGSDPVIDGTLLPQSPFAAFARGEVPNISLMIGTDDNEGSLLGPNPTLEYPDGPTQDWTQLRALYGKPADSDADFARLLFRDVHFSGPARWIAAHKPGATPAYLYRFDYVMSLLRSRRIGADHGSEIPFVFASWSTDRLSQTDRQVTTMLHGCWIAFAKMGTPACEGVPAWPAYRADSDLIMNFAEDAVVRQPPNRAVLDALQALAHGQP